MVRQDYVHWYRGCKKIYYISPICSMREYSTVGIIIEEEVL
jgi:hypothetical protein